MGWGGGFRLHPIRTALPVTTVKNEHSIIGSYRSIISYGYYVIYKISVTTEDGRNCGKVMRIEVTTGCTRLYILGIIFIRPVYRAAVSSVQMRADMQNGRGCASFKYTESANIMQLSCIR